MYVFVAEFIFLKKLSYFVVRNKIYSSEKENTFCGMDRFWIYYKLSNQSSVSNTNSSFHYHIDIMFNNLFWAFHRNDLFALFHSERAFIAFYSSMNDGFVSIFLLNRYMRLTCTEFYQQISLVHRRLLFTNGFVLSFDSIILDFTLHLIFIFVFGQTSKNGTSLYENWNVFMQIQLEWFFCECVLDDEGAFLWMFEMISYSIERKKQQIECHLRCSLT